MEFFELTVMQIMMFIIYALVGIYAVKINFLNEENLNVVAGLIIKITLPIMLFHNTITGTTKEKFFEALPIVFLTIVMYTALFLVAWCLKKAFKLKGNKGKVYHASTMFGNIGFMGIPLIAALFPQQGMLYMVLFTIPDQLILWTVGKELTTPVENTDKIGVEHRRINVAGTLKKVINPSTIAIMLSVVGVFAGWKLPEVLDVSLQKIGAVTSPLAMIYIGALFCFIDIRECLKKIEYYGAVLIKMVAFPILFYLGMKCIPFIEQDMRVTMTILSSLPVMTSIAMLAKTQKSEGDYSAGQVFVTTVCSIVTVPLICLFTQFV